MNKKILKRAGQGTCVALAFIIALSAPGTVFASAASTEKDETVYVNMDTEGKIKETIVSDWLHSDSATTQIPDRSDLKNIENVKSNENPIQNGDSLTWVLNSGNPNGSNIYYKGTTDKKPPLNVAVSYYFNGQKVNGNDLAGKTGKVKIKIKISNNERHDVVINGKTMEMYTPMTAIVTAALPTKNFKNVQLSEGRLYSDGNTQMVTFMTMPGMEKSLNLKGYDIEELHDLDFPEELEITADVEDFELTSIAVAATPELVGVDKIKDSDDIEEMKTNLNKLKSMQDNIEEADPNRDIRTLFTNPDRTAAARILVNDIFDFYDMDKALADILPDYVTDKNIALYDKVTSDLDKADIKYVLDNKVLRGANDRLTDANIQKAKLLLKDYDEIQTFRMSKLDDVIDVLDDYDDIYDRLDDALHDAKKVANRLHTSENALKTMQKLASNKDIDQGIFKLVGSLNQISNTLSAYGINQSTILSPDKVYKYLKMILEEEIGEEIDSKLAEQMKQLMSDPRIVDTEKNTVNVQLLLKVLSSSPDFNKLKDNSEVQQFIIDMKQKIAEKDSNAQTVTISIDEFQQRMKKIADNFKDTTSDELAKTLTGEIMGGVQGAATLQAGLKKEKITSDDLNDTFHSLRFALPTIKELSKDLESIAKDDDLTDNVDKMKDLLLDDDNMHYMHKWARKLRDMKKDLDDNNENVDLMRDLLKEYDDPKIKAFKDMIPTLQDDLDETRPILESLKDKLDEPVYNVSLHKSPETVTTLLRMKDDVLKHRNIMETLRLTTREDTANLFKNTFVTLDDLEDQDAVNDYIKKVNDADELIARKDEYVRLSDEYNIFTKAADGASTKLKFVMKTDEIKKPEVEVKTVEKTESKQDFLAWFKTAFQKAANKITHIF